MATIDHAPPGAAGPRWRCVDSHAHLAMSVFAGDLDGALDRARDAGIGAILTAATTLEDSELNLSIVAGSKGRPGLPILRAAVGLHPHEAKRWTDGDERRLEELARRDGVVAIGEAGLDYHYMFSPAAAQREALACQVRLAARLGLPIVVHSREAAEDTALILEGEGGRVSGGVIHCFTEDDRFARRCLDLGFYISFSGILTFKNAGPLREVARGVPRDRLLVETDAPYLAPVPHRGRRNEPAFASVVLEALAVIRGEEAAELAAAVTENFERFVSRDPGASTSSEAPQRGAQEG